MMWGKGDPLDAVAAAYKARSWKFHRADEHAIVTGVTTAMGAYFFILAKHEVDKKTLLLTFNLLTAPGGLAAAVTGGSPPTFRVHTAEGHSSAQVQGVCEILLHENYRMVLGCFERDANDGEIRFRIALPYRDAKLTVDQVTWALEIGIGSSEIGLAKVRAFLGGGTTVDQALAGGGPLMV